MPNGNPFSTVGFGTGFVSEDIKKALSWARQRRILEKQAFDNLDFQNKLEGWTVAGDLTETSIGSIQKAMNTGIQNGVAFRDFKKALTPEVFDKITVPRVVWRNGINQVYQKGRFDQQQRIKELRPFLEYITFGDDRVRPNHELMNGKVARQDDPFWSRNYPPNGHNCRCVARALSQRNVERRGLDVQTEAQIERDAVKEQDAKGIPKSKQARPLADPQWRGSFQEGQFGAQKLVKTFGKPPTNFVSVISPRPVNLLSRAESLKLKEEPFEAIGKTQAERLKNVELKIADKDSEFAAFIDEDGRPLVFSQQVTTIKSGGKTTVRFTTAETNEMLTFKNPTLIHNHPKFNTGFSGDDIQMMFDVKTEIWAVTPKYRYVGRFLKNTNRKVFERTKTIFRNIEGRTIKTKISEFQEEWSELWNKNIRESRKLLDKGLRTIEEHNVLSTQKTNRELAKKYNFRIERQGR